MSVPNSRVVEVSMATNTVLRAVRQLSKATPERTEQIAVNEFAKAVKARKNSK